MHRHAVSLLRRAVGPALPHGSPAGARRFAEGAAARERRRGQSHKGQKLPPKEPMQQADSDGAAHGDVVADVCYRQSSRILLVGEANFSFASALCRRFGDGSGLTACSLETREALLERFGTHVSRRLADLEQQLCGVQHDLPVAEMPERFRPNSFDCVAFNFPIPISPGRAQPSAAAPDGAEPEQGSTGAPAEAAPSHSDHLRSTYAELSALLAEFFRGAAYVLRPGGECHVRLTDQHVTTRGLRSAEEFGLTFYRRVDFHEAFEKVYKPLGYRPSAVLSAKHTRRKAAKVGFGVQHSSTLVFSRGRHTL